MDAQSSTVDQQPQKPSAEVGTNPANPRLVELANQLRVIRNIANILDGFEIKGVQTAGALIEASRFIEGLHNQVEAQVGLLEKELSNVETPKANQAPDVPAPLPANL
jgi:hypothetical protein